MGVKTSVPHEDIVEVFSGYNLGDVTWFEATAQGSVQTNYIVQTTCGKFVFRCYENRTQEAVLFERDLLLYLGERDYPFPALAANRQEQYVGLYRDKPYMIFEFLEGQHIEQPSLIHWQQLIYRAAQLQSVTRQFRSRYTPHRWNYDPALCLALARAESARLDSHSARDKLDWLSRELKTLDLPSWLPRGICHCDFHFSNVLFDQDEFVALLDFDDANYTYLQFDLVGLIEYWAWPHDTSFLDLTKARSVVQEYMQHRALSPIEQQHLYDVYKLSILFDCVWFFGRGFADDFYEKRKIEALNHLGREAFIEEVFCE